MRDTVMQEEAEACAPRGARDDKRDAIVRTALAAFLAEGYAETSMSSLAAKMGGSKATLYSYFKSKEELFAAVVGLKCEQICNLLNQAAIDGGGELEATLRNFGERFVALILNDDSIGTFRLAIAEASRFPEIGRAIYDSGVRKNHRRLADFLEQAQVAGRLRADADVMCAAEQFLDLCLSGIHRRRLWNVPPEPTPEEIRESVGRAVTTFMRAFAA